MGLLSTFHGSMTGQNFYPIFLWPYLANSALSFPPSWEEGCATSEMNGQRVSWVCGGKKKGCVCWGWGKGYRFKGQRGKKGGADTVIAPMIFPEREGWKGEANGKLRWLSSLALPPRRKGMEKVKKKKGRILCIPPKKRRYRIGCN